MVFASNQKKCKVGFLNAAVMGTFQGVGMIPGISRSGSTILGGVSTGLDKNTAARFSFMMSAPAIVGSLLMGLIYSFLTITLRANQNVTGLALTTFGVGIGNFFGGSLIKLTGAEVPNISLSATSICFRKTLPFADKLGVFGNMFLKYGFLAYLAVIIALCVSYFLNRTQTGLHPRAVGENPSTADAAGINVTRYKYVATCIGSMIAGLGGLYYVMDYANGIWSNDGFGDRGWLAIALVIFTVWRPTLGILSSILFGGLYILSCTFLPE